MNTAALANLKQPFWFCLKAAPKREHIAAATLRRELQLAAFAPRIRFRKLTQRGKIWFVEPMFPGYVFAEFEYADHRRVIHARGLRGLVHFGDDVPVVAPAVISLLRRTDDDAVVTVEPHLEVGQRVEVAEGPFQGFEAIVTTLLPARDRLRVLLEFLGRNVETELHETQVVPPSDEASATALRTINYGSPASA
ncbi:MAG: hypothetical protein H0W20_02340 [Chthoniobacterales bacterium]|jgi:transcriptional antiterminator RfaH|nr:hypothetical protein [Chthoniobacterales bacterium]